MSDSKIILGALEVCSLPELGIAQMDMRVDTGAKTSSLHVDNIQRVKKNGKSVVSFDIHPDMHNVDRVISCEAPLTDIRRIKSSNGNSEERYVIKSLLDIGGHSWPIEITLTDRSDMTYLMLLGRQGMSDRVLVDPSETFLMSSD